MKELKEHEEKAQQDTEAELLWQTIEAEAARAVESPPQDKNNEELDYIDDVDRDTEMTSSQETVPMSSQESQEASTNQGTAPASSQEMTSTSQESMRQDTASMPSQDSTANATILNTGRIPMEDETCLEGPTMRCTLDEERALLNPLLTGSLDQLEDVPLGYLNVLVAHINEFRKVKASKTPVPLPRALPRLLPPQPAPMPLEPSTTASLSEAIYSATSNLGTSVPC